MVHQVDFSDLGLFSGHGAHPLTFLTVPDRLYRAMGSQLGLSNRVLPGGYRDTLARLGYEVQVKVTKIRGEHDRLPAPSAELVSGRDFGERHAERVEQIRPRLLPRYRSLPVQELVSEAALIVARKPHRG
jgi:hypothetical protein